MQRASETESLAQDPAEADVAPRERQVSSAWFERFRAIRSRGGEPLSPSVRQFMEPRFSASFERVKVHRDAEADALSRAVNARAFTVGQDVFFKRGEFAPGTERGQRLIAHELAHSVQQGRSVPQNGQHPAIQRQVANPAQPDASSFAGPLTEREWQLIDLWLSMGEVGVEPLTGDANHNADVVAAAIFCSRALSTLIMSQNEDPLLCLDTGVTVADRRVQSLRVQVTARGAIVNWAATTIDSRLAYIMTSCAVLRLRILGLGQPRGRAPAWLALSIAVLGSVCAKPVAAAPRIVPGLPRVVTTLDANQGRRALAAYGQYMDRFCKGLRHSGAGPARQLREAGFSSDADPEVLCAAATRFVRPIASGSLVVAQSQEVLLEVPSGCDAAYGERTLALMRETRSGYRLVTHLLSGGRFDARVRVATTHGLDRLVLCQSYGNMGVYPSRCGFFDQGSFSGPGANRDAPPDTRNEFELVATTTCGMSSTVSLGNVTLRDQRLQVELVIEQSVREPSGPDESPNDPVCSKCIVQARESFTLEYELRGATIQRLTPTPKPVQAVLERY